ncbi:MAG TPA: hypothetical protein VGD74_02310 [Vulgatibacter sp.]
MAWSYSGNPGASTKDEVRFLIGDTTEGDPLLSDEEIAYLLEQADDSAPRAAVAACEASIAKLAREADMSSGATSISASQRRDGLVSLLSQIKRRAHSRPRIRFGGSEPARFQRSDDKYGRP